MRDLSSEMVNDRETTSKVRTRSRMMMMEMSIDVG